MVRREPKEANIGPGRKYKTRAAYEADVAVAAPDHPAAAGTSRGVLGWVWWSEGPPPTQMCQLELPADKWELVSGAGGGGETGTPVGKKEHKGEQAVEELKTPGGGQHQEPEKQALLMASPDEGDVSPGGFDVDE